MVFNKNIPQPGDKLSQSQQDLLNNNLQLNTSFGINHYPFDDLTANNGKHNYIQLPNRTLPVGLVSGDETIYSKAIAGSGELVFTRGNSGVEIQLTGPGNPSATTNGYTFLPGGLLMQWGVMNGTASSGQILFVTSNVNFPNNCFTVLLTAKYKSSIGPELSQAVYEVDQDTLSNTLFNWIRVGGTSNTRGFYWIAIGN